MSTHLKFTRRTVLALPLALAACGSERRTLRFSGAAMGTTYNIVAIDRTGGLSEATVQAAIDGALGRVDAELSNWSAASEVSRFNAGAGSATVSAGLASVAATADQVHRASGGQFDVTLGPVIELWGFGATGKPGVAPSDAALDAAMSSTGQGRVLDVKGNVIAKRDPKATIFVSGIGKGFGVDAVGAALKSLGVDDYMVEIGGDVVTAGLNPEGGSWRVGIEAPDAATRTPRKIVALSGMGLATSGDYRNFFVQDGKRYSHIIDAQTGRPVSHATASATVLAENAMLADAWATGMLALGRERGLEVAEAEGLAVLFIERGADGFVVSESRKFSALQA